MGHFRRMSDHGDFYREGTDVKFPDGVPVCIFANQGGGATADHNTVNQIHIPEMPVNIHLTIQSLVIGNGAVTLPAPVAPAAPPPTLIGFILQLLGLAPPPAPPQPITAQGNLEQVRLQLQEQLTKDLQEQVGKVLLTHMKGGKNP